MADRVESQRLEIALSAAGSDEGAVLLSDFQGSLEGILEFLNALDARIDGKRQIDWIVADLHHSRPTIVLEPRDSADLDRVTVVLKCGFSALSDMAEGREIGHWGEDAIEGIKRLLRPIGRTVKSAAFRVGDSVRLIDVDFLANFAWVEANKEVFEEEWQGYLFEINLAPKSPTFRLHQILGRNFITCDFARKDKDKVTAALEKKVSVIGDAAYRPGAKFPNRISVRRFDVLDAEPDDGFLEVLASQGGTGDFEEAMNRLRELRDGWH